VGSNDPFGLFPADYVRLARNAPFDNAAIRAGCAKRTRPTGSDSGH